ncbi:hypothetical protein VPNG_04980 [Cytospora leucostoma]|uniref:Vacuolar sorting protein Vps3844 C-terminal domain-containing protein n=1 Tax=Cytospora leucostoma TaxID=1230097 RepID=A0A423X7W2_9PEZI|nr:hypothetical protein VPNG_04980 [Cytospora leucostoma]
MRFLNGLALAGLAGLSVGATPEPAEVYILSSTPYRYSSSSSQPALQLPRQLVRDILFQRVTDGSHLSSVVDDDKVLSHISQYGGTPKPLFGEEFENVAPSQLVVLLEGVTEKNAKSLKDQIQQKGHDIAFEISDAPSRKANQHLVDIEFAAMGVSGSCDIAAAVNPYDSCWNGMSLVVKYDVTKHPDTLESLVDEFPSLSKAIASGTLEATLVFLPESTRSSKHAYWTNTTPTGHQRRLEETPITDLKTDTKTDKVATSPAKSPASEAIELTYNAGAAADKVNLGCFTSYSSCVTATNNCTGHGKCLDKFAIPGKEFQEGDRQCFTCSCLSTKKFPEQENSKHVHWGGAYCQKIDVSSPFWLIASTTVILVGLVAGSIGLLFNVGEEKLPGVIGAGVSRSK